MYITYYNLTIMDLTNLFAEETKELKLLLDLIEIDIGAEDFDDCCKNIDEIIQQSYQNNSTDIEDLGDLIMLLDNKIEQMFLTSEKINKYHNLILLRKKVKKLAHKKFREGYDWIHKNKIDKGIVKSIIKYQDEIPRNYLNVEECEIQYHELVNFVWKPNVEKFKIKYLNNFD